MSESGKIVVGSVAVRVVPDATGFASRASAQITPEAKVLGRQIGEQLGRDMSAHIAPAIRDAIGEGTRTAKTQGARSGEDFGGSFATLAKTRIEAALKNLPKAKVGTDASELDAELVSIRTRLAALRDVRIGVDLDAGEALAEIEALQVRLAVLAERSPHIDVKVDSGRAFAELAAIQAAVDSLKSGTNLPGGGSGLAGLAETGPAIAAGLSAAAIAAGLLAAALIPVAAGLAAVVGAATLLGAIGGGALIAFAVGIAPIVKVMLALSASDKQTAATATASATARVAATEAVRSATASLANAQASADSAAIRSAEAVTSARQAVADAERSSAQSITRAIGAQAAAEGALAAAQRDTRNAQEALTQARKDAKQNLEDLARAAKGAALDERQAALSITEARQHLQEVQSNPLATAAERQQAKLDYDKAVQQLDDVTARNKTLASTKAQADAAGVNGAKNVKDAQQAVLDAIARQGQAQKSLADATAAVTEARRSGAEAIARAEQQVTDALRSQSDQARQSAFAISQAQAAVAAAQRQQRTASQSATAAANEAKAAFDKLSPAGQTFVTFLRGTFLPALHDLATAATDGLVPGLTAGLVAIMPVLPQIATDFGRLATAAGDLFAQAGRALASPFWVNFLDFVSSLAGPALSGFGSVIGDIATGIAGFLIAIEPTAAKIGGTVKDLAQRFADWGKSAGKGGSLDKFLTFLNDKGPGIADDLAKVAKAVAEIVIAAAPLGVKVLHALADVADAIDHIRTPLRLLFTAIGAFVGQAATDIKALTGAFDTIKDAVVGTYRAVTGKLGDLLTWYRGLHDKFYAVDWSGAFDGIKDAFKGAINYMIKAWNDLSFKLPEVDTHIPGIGKVGGFEINTPNIKPLALGGIVTAPTLALVGEAGPEAVVPLARMAEMASLFNGHRASSSGATAQKAGTVIERFEQNVYNPLPERPSETAATTTRRLEHLLS